MSEVGTAMRLLYLAKQFQHLDLVRATQRIGRRGIEASDKLG